MRPIRLLLVPLALSTLACSGSMFKSCTSTMVGKTVQTTKEVTSGVAEGIEEGRKAGTSVDGAVIVSTPAELDAHGGVALLSVEDAGEGAARVTLAFENKGEQPLRVTGIRVGVLDDQGFVQQPTSSPASELTVPPRAKERLSFEVGIPAAKVGTVRAWDRDLPRP